MAWQVAINGFGRIGRSLLRACYERRDLDALRIVAINDLADAEAIAHLTRYDSVHGRFPGTAAVVKGRLRVQGDDIALHATACRDRLPWRQSEVALVMECSGSFNDRATAEGHLRAGAERVLLSWPARSDVDATVVYGFNHGVLRADHRIVSNASCTTNCLVPALAVIDDSFGIEAGLISTIHSAMNDQPVLDSFHDADLRKTRSALHSFIPVETALAAGVERFLPRLRGRLGAQAIRVPTINVSALDLSLQLGREATADEVNAVLRDAAATLPANVLGYTDERLASCDFNHDARSAVVDLKRTRVAGRRLLSLFLWFDNEWAYANRMLDVAAHWASLAPPGDSDPPPRRD